MDKNILLVHNKFQNVLSKIPDKKIDLTLTDPPYGIGLDYDNYNDTQDNLKAMIKELMPELLRVSKVILLTPGVTNQWLYPQPDWVLGWVYKGGGNRSPWGFNCWQPILAYGKDPYLANGMGCRPDYFEVPESIEKNGHPCPKPLKTWTKMLLRGSVKEGDLILDPFGGSMTTAIAALMTKRRCICIEQSAKYVELGQRLVNKFLAQPTFFDDNTNELIKEAEQIELEYKE